MPFRVALSYVYISLLILFGTIICLYYGRIGFMPLDQSIVFDGAWRVINGQIPYKDFNTSAGVPPILIQAVFFKILGISWFSYCLHAALFNGLFCVLIYYLLRQCGVSQLLSFFYGMMSGVIFYPPMGTPFLDQHAFFFTALYLTMSIGAIQTNNIFLRYVILFSIPFVIGLSYFSKQIPTIFGLPCLMLILYRLKNINFFKKVIVISAGAIVFIIILSLLIYITNIDYNQMYLYFIDLPAAEGKRRMGQLLSLAKIVSIINACSSINYKLIIVILCSLIAIGLLWLLIITLKRKSSDNAFKIGYSINLLGICALFVLLTDNQKLNGVPYLFVSIGIIHVVINNLYKDSDANQYNSRRNNILINSVFIIPILVMAVVFNITVNATRHVNDMYYLKSFKNGHESVLPTQLSFMIWFLPEEYKYNKSDLIDIIKFFHSKKENFFLIGDTSILYALANRISVNPSLYYHFRVCFPGPEDKGYREYVDKLRENIKKYHVKYIVLEGDGCWFENVNLSYFNKMLNLVQDQQSPLAKIGGFTIYSLND